MPQLTHTVRATQCGTSLSPSQTEKALPAGTCSDGKGHVRSAPLKKVSCNQHDLRLATPSIGASEYSVCEHVRCCTTSGGFSIPVVPKIEIGARLFLVWLCD